MSILRSGAVLTATVGIALLTPLAAHADPVSTGETFQLTCGGETFDVVVSGGGNFTPAHDVNSTTMFVPTYFGEGTATITNTVTGEVQQFVEPGGSKGSATKERRTSTECTYSTTFEFPDEVTGDLLVGVFSGTVAGFYTPTRG